MDNRERSVAYSVPADESGSTELHARSTDCVTSDYKVRRLTPKECARLQGFPPDWCDGIPHTDSAEYKLWGNGIALPCLLPMLKAMKERGCETLGNFFSGSGAWELAGQIVGLRPVYESEIEAFPVKLEAERFPECIQLGDITKVNPEDVPYVDVMTNSSPCQNLSNAGNRTGLKGEQSELFTDVIRVTRGLRDLGRLPRFWCWENVPGALSCSRGEDFRIVLQEIARVVQEDAVIPLPSKGKWLTAGVVDGDNWQMLGESWMPNITESPRDAEECFLWQVLETTGVPQRYYLSERACLGIMRRAYLRGKTLNSVLETALVAQANLSWAAYGDMKVKWDEEK